VPLAARGSTCSLDLLRFLQEALTNMLKHSAASHTEVRVQRNGERLYAEVRDNGQGFDPDTSPKTTGTGLSSMRIRATHPGGKLVITSIPGSNTTIGVDVLLRHPSQQIK
jgi:signal transduction histidine kinase